MNLHTITNELPINKMTIKSYEKYIYYNRACRVSIFLTLAMFLDDNKQLKR